MKNLFALPIKKLVKLDWILVGAVMLLCSIGLLELYSLSPSIDGVFLIFKKQILFILIGFLLMLCVAFLDCRVIRDKSASIFIIFLLGVVLLVALSFWGTTVSGSRSWFNFGVINFGPVEIVKVTLILLLAKFFSTRHAKSSSLKPILISSIYVLIPAILVALQPDLGSASILILIWLGMVVLSGTKKKHLLIIFLVFLVTVSAMWVYFLKDYQKDRILSYLEPEKDPWGDGYNVVQSLAAISSGGFWGKGIGQGAIVQLGFLPARHNDFIFASICEEMGILGGIVVVVLYGIIFWRLSIISLSVRDNFSLLIVGGVFALFISQCFINMGINTGLIPVTGLSLPFVSYGGSGIISSFIAIGLVLSVKSQQC
jgi:rod shape determining protein RodA